MADAIDQRMVKVESRLDAKASRLNRVETSVNHAEDEIDELQRESVEHETRLANGRKVFDAHDKRLAVIEERTTPAPPSVMKIVALTLGIFMALSGALWALSEKLADRPTVKQLDQVLKKSNDHHETSGHTSMRDDVRQIQTEQIRHRHQLDVVQKTQATHGSQLKKVLDRLPKPRRRNNRR